VKWSATLKTAKAVASALQGEIVPPKSETGVREMH